MLEYSNLAFLILKVICLCMILLGYFMNQQELNKAQKDIGSPIFQNKKDYFYSGFRRVILIVDESFTGFDSDDIYYHIDSQFSIDYALLYNTIIHGISPISQLQYWNVQYSSLDSLTYQLLKHDKISYLSSYKSYSQYDQSSQYIELEDGIQLKNKIDEDNFAFLYVDNLQLSTKEYDQILDMIDNTTMLIILRFDQVYFKTTRNRLSNETHSSHIYSIDSLTSTISCILDIPIPLENHGVILPGLIYETIPNEEQIIMQLNDYMINLYQLYEHYSLIEKTKSIKYQKDLDQFADQFNFIMSNKDNVEIKTFLKIIQKQIDELALIINIEISGNIFVLILGLFLNFITLYLIYFKNQEYTTIDFYVIAITFCFALLQKPWVIIALFALLSLKMRQPFIQIILGFLILINSIIFFKIIISIGSIIYFYIKNKLLIHSLFFSLGKIDLIKILIIFILSLIAKYQPTIYIVIIILIIIQFKFQIDLIILCICLSVRISILIPIILLSFQYFKENENSYFKNPANLIIQVIFVIITTPCLSSNPMLTNFSVYLRVLDIIALIGCQQFFYNFQTQLKQSLEINQQTSNECLKKSVEIKIDYFDPLFPQLIIEIIWLIQLILVEIMSTNIRTIGSQYFTLQYCCLNLLLIILFIVRGGNMQSQQSNELQEEKEYVYNEKHDVQMREIEI